MKIEMPDLIKFLSRNGFESKFDDIMAILRRHDHDADACISLEEFAEACGYDYSLLLADREASI